jgi:hypothetical protein
MSWQPEDCNKYCSQIFAFLCSPTETQNYQNCVTRNDALPRALTACSGVQPLGANVYEGCMQAFTNGTPPRDADTWLCNTVGAETIYRKYGVFKCGYKLDDTAEKQMFDAQAGASGGGKNTQNAVIIFMMLLIVGVGYFTLKPTKTA